jgi:hypothetical protein
MGKNGGARPGAGRKPKIQEIKIIEQMDAICVPEKIWSALLMKCSQGDTQALKLWLSYRFGLPKQQIDITSNGQNIAPPIQWISKQIEFKDAEQIEFESVDTFDELKNQVRQDYKNLIDQDKENKQSDQFDMFIL